MEVKIIHYRNRKIDINYLQKLVKTYVELENRFKAPEEETDSEFSLLNGSKNN